MRNNLLVSRPSKDNIILLQQHETPRLETPRLIENTDFFVPKKAGSRSVLPQITTHSALISPYQQSVMEIKSPLPSLSEYIHIDIESPPYEVIILVDKDAMVTNRYPDVAFGTVTTHGYGVEYLGVSIASDPEFPEGHEVRWSYIALEAESIPSNYISVSLFLYCVTTAGGAGVPETVFVGEVTDNWLEDIITWNNQPNVKTPLIAPGVPATSFNSFEPTRDNWNEILLSDSINLEKGIILWAKIPFYNYGCASRERIVEEQRPYFVFTVPGE